MLLVRPVHNDLPTRVQTPASRPFLSSASCPKALCSRGTHALVRVLDFKCLRAMQDHLGWDRVHVVGHRSAPAFSKPDSAMVLLSMCHEPVRLDAAPCCVPARAVCCHQRTHIKMEGPTRRVHSPGLTSRLLQCSMGGMVACKLAAQAPHRICSLTVISSTGGHWQAIPKSWRTVKYCLQVCAMRCTCQVNTTLLSAATCRGLLGSYIVCPSAAEGRQAGHAYLQVTSCCVRQQVMPCWVFASLAVHQPSALTLPVCCRLPWHAQQRTGPRWT